MSAGGGMGVFGRRRRVSFQAFVSSALALAILAFLCALSARNGHAAMHPAPASRVEEDLRGEHLGVASCASSTCHGRQEPTGAIVRQDEVARWQDETSAAGAHSRAWRVLGQARAQAIAERLGIGDPQRSAQCLSCHADPAPVHAAGFRIADGVGCEACHGGGARWIASHAATSATHARNVAAGMVPLDDPQARAAVCLDCHLGSDAPGQFVDHRIMAAGHPRLSFELDLFSTLEQHWNEDADYVARKGRPSPVRFWAIGQADALVRALTVYSGPRGSEGAFPEFAFFDCHTCHRRIGDEAGFRPSALANPGRPIAIGMPAFQDENIIMLSAAARVLAPEQAARFDGDARAFHAALGQGRPQAIGAAARLRTSAAALAAGFAQHRFDRGETLAILHAVAVGAAARYTDYQASVQAVMAIDTLLSALVKQGAIQVRQAAAIRADIDHAYRAVHDPNDYHALDFRAALSHAADAVRGIA